jgi:type IV secretory pathway TrbD component
VNHRTADSEELIALSRWTILGAGYVAGVMGGWTMSQFSRIWNKLSGSMLAPLPYSEQEWEAASGVAELFSARVLRRKLSDRGRMKGAALVHYGTAGTAGALYAAVLSRQIQSSIWSGALFGVAMWMVANALLDGPLAHGKKPDRFTAGTQAQALAEHLTYGVTVGLLCRARDRLLMKI